LRGNWWKVSRYKYRGAQQRAMGGKKKGAKGKVLKGHTGRKKEVYPAGEGKKPTTEDKIKDVHKEKRRERKISGPG